MTSTSVGDEPAYYMLEYAADEDEAVLSVHPDEYDPDLDWHCGERFEKAPNSPVRLVIYRGDAGNGVIPEQCDVPLPVMSKRLMTLLLEAGVSNIDFYDAVISDEENGAEHKTHVAYNLIGAIAAADAQQTRFSSGNQSRLVDADIDGLAIDAAKARGALMFRLAESVNGIVVHASIKRVIEAAHLATLMFVPPDEWVG